MEDTFAEGAGVFPIAEGDKTITIFDGWFPFFSAFFDSYEDTTFFQEMEKRTGVKTEFTLVNAEMAAEQFNLMVEMCIRDRASTKSSTTCSFGSGKNRTFGDPRRS